MMIMSFAWTTPAVRARRKTRTRRQWAYEYAKRFKVGDICQAYDRQPRFGGVKIGTIKITGKKKELISKMPDEDYEREGFAFMEERGMKIWGKQPRKAFEDWKRVGGYTWVVDFEIINLT